MALTNEAINLPLNKGFFVSIFILLCIAAKRALPFFLPPDTYDPLSKPINYLRSITISSLPSTPEPSSSIESNISLKAYSVKPPSTPSFFMVSITNYFVSSLSRSPEPSLS
jgi:hypothetical protein